MRYHLFAPAKINLDLSITGLRADGYHTLKSHVAFANCGDDIVMDIVAADDLSCTLDIDGEFAWQLEGLDHRNNLAYKAVEAFAGLYDLMFTANIHLVKNLPSGAGMGGGSADAAAILRALVNHFGIDDRDKKFLDLCLSLGADVPVCYHAKPCLMEGIGEILSPWQMADTDAILIWPGAGGSTRDLYATYDQAPHSCPPNDFLPHATRFCPNILEALAWLAAQPNCLKSALTGSGTAVFGLFSEPATIGKKPDFPWVMPCIIGSPKKPLVMDANTR